MLCGDELVGARRDRRRSTRDAERVDADRLGRGEPLAARELERPLEPGHRDLDRVARDAELAEELQRAPLERARLRSPRRRRGSRSASAMPGGERAAAELDRRGGEQRLGAERRPLGTCFERRGEAPLRLVELDPAQPERQQGDAEPQRIVRLAREQDVERGAQVRRLAVEPRRAALVARRARAPSWRAGRATRGCFAGIDEPLACVHADGLEQAVASSRGLRPRPRRATSRRAAPAGRRPPAHSSPSPAQTSSAASSSKPPAKIASRRNSICLVGLEQVVAPLQRRRQRLLPGRRGVAPGAQQTEAVVEALRDRRRAERADAARRRARARAAARRGGSRCARRRPRSPRRARSPARPRRRGRRRARRPRTRAARPGESGCSGSGMSSDGTRKTTSPGTRSGSRLVATIVSCGAERSSVSASAAVAPSTCSQLSRTSSSVRGARKSTTASTSPAPAGRGRRARLRPRRGRAVRRRARASSTRAAPASYDGSALRASSSASRVLPAPPVPDSVRSRVRRSSDVSSGELLASADERARVAGQRRTASPHRSRRPPPRARPPAPRARRGASRPSRRSGSRAGARRRRARARRGRPRASRRGARSAAAGSNRSTSTSAVRKSTSSRSSIASASSARRATCTAWWRLFAAAAGSRSRQSTSIACSRWRRWPGASASSFTSSRAFFRRQARRAARSRRRRRR